MANIKSTEAQSVCCPLHPKNRQALSFCFECRVAFCFACRIQPKTIHSGHRAELIESAFETCAAQHRVARETLKEAARADKVGHAARDADRAARGDSLYEALRLVDSTCDGLLTLVENMRTAAHAILFSAAERVDRRTERLLQWQNQLKMETITNLENLVSSSENQSEIEILFGHSNLLVALEAVGNSDMPATSSLDVEDIHDIADLINSTSTRFHQAADELDFSFRSLKFASRVGEQKLVEVGRFGPETIKTETDRDELLVLGIAEASTDTIYIADSYNSKLKRLNIKTRQVDQVHSNYLTSYFFNVVINWKFK